MIELYDSVTGTWRKETKEEVMVKRDIEGNHPCEECWESARDSGIYSWPLKISPSNFKRCRCNRMIGIIKESVKPDS